VIRHSALCVYMLRVGRILSKAAVERWPLGEIMKLEIRRNLISVLAFVGFIWLIFLINVPLSVTDWNLVQNYGLKPRTVSGLVGIFTMPFLHDGFEHLLGNTIPLAVLLFMLSVTRENARRIWISITVLAGLFTWVIGLSSPVVGASSLVYGLTAYLITAGIHERKLVSAGTAVLGGVLYGGTLAWGLSAVRGKKCRLGRAFTGGGRWGCFCSLHPASEVNEVCQQQLGCKGSDFPRRRLFQNLRQSFDSQWDGFQKLKFMAIQHSSL
jgi:membrane associated rhomboid family serine protease